MGLTPFQQFGLILVATGVVLLAECTMSEKICFVIAPIGDPDSDTRKRSDKILKHVITPAVESCGYKAVRADKISEPGMITSQIIEHIVEDALVIADLTDRNPNVFYELAFRHVVKKPFIHIINKGEKIPFDVHGLRTVEIDLADPDSVLEAKTEVGNQIKSLENNSDIIETPFSVPLDLKALRQRVVLTDELKKYEKRLLKVRAAYAKVHTELVWQQRLTGMVAGNDEVEYVIHMIERILATGGINEDTEELLRDCWRKMKTWGVSY